MFSLHRSLKKKEQRIYKYRVWRCLVVLYALWTVVSMIPGSNPIPGGLGGGRNNFQFRKNVRNV